MTNRSPTLPKWPFILADVLLLAVSAWMLLKVLPTRTSGAYVVAGCAVVAWIVGAFICVWPWLVEFKAQSQQMQNDNLTDALKQIERLEEIGGRVQSATASWQSAQDSALRVTQAAKEVEERVKAQSKEFMDFAERISNDEKQHLRLELEKLRRTESEWLQVAARMLDHTFALTAAAARSGQPNLVTQMTNFQNACRDAARRVGLIPFHPAVGEAFDERTQQLEEPDAKGEEGAVVSDILATGFTFQGQLLRKALVRVSGSQPQAEPQPTDVAHETPVFKPDPQEEQTDVAEQAEEVHEERTVEPQTEEVSEPAVLQPDSLEENVVEESSLAEVAPEPESSVSQEEPGVEVATTEAAPGSESNEPAFEDEKPRRKQRKPDPQASLPF
ncbi:MAG TPA: nucleotide exchange factor GrpE [Verrucomicrobiae bacterium]|nr:nucleotide exchange factor GrpE [Verrucomicrobiae bacterium]